eukprot:CAMPEP_0184687606 /NCGR_PEP_ID=MMETSP0312-20130426/27087_1 /TAXON_ID=31354 /ORGANISM="Compsopogon coeruleus, Strain SAG 36.94" /LENGTH=47 /DNA_ID= /DNA_START= /DNA_END= /DNA_ORIENTATION=
MAWFGDMSDQNVCSDKQEGFPAINPMSQRNWDIIVATGDFTYMQYRQ